MMKKRLVIPENTPAFLKVSKEEGVFQGELFLVLPNGENYHLNASSDNFLIDLSDKEGKKIDGVIKDNCFISDNDVIVKQYKQMFSKNLIADLHKSKKGGAVVAIDKIRICHVSDEELPANLFDRRSDFKVNITNDENWTIVRYANLHQHTEFSLLDGIVKVKDLANKVEYCSAVTDHGNMYAVHEFVKAMNKLGKKPIYGSEFYIQTLNGPRPDSSLLKDNDNTEERMFGKDKKQNPEGFSGEHLIVLAKNDKGIKNLFKLSTESFDKIKPGVPKPHTTIEDLKKYHEGLIVTSACIAGTVGQSIKAYLSALSNKYLAKLVKEDPFFYKKDYELPKDEVDKCAVEVYSYNHKLCRTFIDTMVDIFKEDFYFELQNHHFDLEDAIMNEIRKIQKEEYPNVKLVVGIDAHYLNKEDAETHEVWLCRQTQSSMLSEKHMKFVGDGYWVHTSDEVVELFKDDLEALDNTLEIADKISYSPFKQEYHLPHYPLPEGFKDEEEYLRHLVTEGFKNRFKGTENYKSKVYRDRIRTELDTIIGMGWPAYFLIVQDYIAWAKDDNVKDNLEKYFPSNHFDHSKIRSDMIKDYEIYVGAGRGSGAGSLVNYVLGITDIDPMPYGLLFER